MALEVHGDFVDDDLTTRARLQRFLRPMGACVALDRQLKGQATEARDAIAAIERRAITDLATGIVMAQRDCDATTARKALAVWSERTGFDLRELSAARMLELLTADQGPAGD